jgi:hypothetical protein
LRVAQRHTPTMIEGQRRASINGFAVSPRSMSRFSMLGFKTCLG